MTQEKLRVLFVAPHPIEGPSSRFRIYQFLPWLRAHDVEAEVRPFLSSRWVGRLYDDGIAVKAGLTLAGLAGRLGDVGRARRFDLVVVLREAFALGPPLIERLLQSAAGRLMFDFDDAIYMPSLIFENPIDRLRDFSKPQKILGFASAATTGNAHLASYARRHVGPGVPVDVIPTVVDSGVYRPSQRTEGGVVIGWIGTPRGSAYLQQLAPVLRKVSAACPEARFVFVGATPFDLGGLPVEFRPWSLEREPLDVASFDIGLMPLNDDEETRGKCAFKMIQYMSCGVAAVASPVGANVEVATNDVDARLPRDEDEWVDAITELARNADRRRALGDAGRQTVVSRYSLTATAPRLLACLKSAAAR